MVMLTEYIYLQSKMLGYIYIDILILLTFLTSGLPSFVTWTSFMPTLRLILLAWSLFTLLMKVPRANTAAARTCFKKTECFLFQNHDIFSIKEWNGQIKEVKSLKHITLIQRSNDKILQNKLELIIAHVSIYNLWQCTSLHNYI